MVKGRAIFKRIMGTYTIIFIIIIYAPFFIIGFLSFTGPNGGVTFPVNYPLGLHWYKMLFEVSSLFDSLKLSFTIAATTLVISTFLGTISAIAFRTKFKGSNVVFLLIILDLVTAG